MRCMHTVHLFSQHFFCKFQKRSQEHQIIDKETETPRAKIQHGTTPFFSKAVKTCSQDVVNIVK